MKVIFYKSLKMTPSFIYMNVNELVVCPSGNVIIKLDDNSEIKVKKNLYKCFRITEEKENK